jgi:hypothetical protein
MPDTSGTTDYWSQQTNPNTGLPYTSETEYTSVQKSLGAQAAGNDAGVASQNAYGQQFTQDHTTGYNFGQGNVWTPADVGGTTGGIVYFGSSSGGDSKTWIIKDPVTGQLRPATDAEKRVNGDNFTGYASSGDLAKRGVYEVPSNGGYIDPNTGKITYSTGGSAYGGGSGNETKDYWYDQDYGLGPSAKGVIPVQYDQNGTPTKFYAGTGGGGGQVFGDLSQAIASVAEYKSWYDQKHPAGTAGTQIAPTAGGATTTPATTTAATTPGTLTTPGTGENYYTDTASSYQQPTNAQTTYDQTKGIYGQTTNAQQVFNETPNQPTESQQLWNQYSGMYANPNYLDDYYNTQQQKTQTALDRRAASAGVGDSSAAARAVAGIGLDFSNQKLLARQGFTKEGMSEAGAADASGLAQTNLRGTLAGSADSQNLGLVTAGQNAALGVDTANLAQTTAGQSAANSAETLMNNRLTGELNSATTLAQDESALTEAGLSAATASSYASQLGVLQAQWQQAGLTAQQQYQKAQDLAASMGVVANSSFDYYLSTKLGGGNGTGSTTPKNPYVAPTASDIASGAAGTYGVYPSQS